MVQRSGIDTIKYHTWPRIPMGKWQTHRRHHKREPRGQPFPSRWPQSTYKQTRTKHSKHKTEQKHKRSTKEVPPWNGQLNILLEGLNQFYGANLTHATDVDQDTFGKVTKHNTHTSQEVSPFPAGDHKATKNRHDITTHTNMKHYLQKRSTKEAPPWNGQ